MRSIQRFIDVYNKYIMLRSKSSNDAQLIQNVNASKFEEDTIEHFLYGFNFPKTHNWMTLYFDRDYAGVPKRYLGFATNGNYNLLYVYDKATGKIFCWDYEDNSLDWPCGISVPAFFDSMSLVLERDIKGIEENNWDFDVEYSMSIFQRCKAFNNGQEEFAEFYEHLLGIE